MMLLGLLSLLFLYHFVSFYHQLLSWCCIIIYHLSPLLFQVVLNVKTWPHPHSAHGVWYGKGRQYSSCTIYKPHRCLVSNPDPSLFRSAGCIASPIHPALRKREGSGFETNRCRCLNRKDGVWDRLSISIVTSFDGSITGDELDGAVQLSNVRLVAAWRHSGTQHAYSI